MSNSNSLDNISLNSDDFKSIHRFENDYYNYKIKKYIQIGGKNKLNNIERLLICYLISKNQTGGDSILTNKIRTKINNKIFNNLEGGIFLDIHKNLSSLELPNISKSVSDFIINTLKACLTLVLIILFFIFSMN